MGRDGNLLRSEPKCAGKQPQPGCGQAAGKRMLQAWRLLLVMHQVVGSDFEEGERCVAKLLPGKRSERGLRKEGKGAVRH